MDVRLKQWTAMWLLLLSNRDRRISSETFFFQLARKPSLECWPMNQRYLAENFSRYYQRQLCLPEISTTIISEDFFQIWRIFYLLRTSSDTHNFSLLAEDFLRYEEFFIYLLRTSSDTKNFSFTCWGLPQIRRIFSFTCWGLPQIRITFLYLLRTSSDTHKFSLLAEDFLRYEEFLFYLLRPSLT